MSATTTPNGTNSDGVPPAAYRIVFNVGGCKFETSRQTIRRIRGTRLTHLLDANEQSDGEEIFIDRDGTKFEYVLNFLRNGYILHVDDDGDELFDVLEKEAQFYGISEMANLCRSMREPLRHNEAVRWRKDAIPHYWRLFLKCLIDKTLHIPFTYERNSFFYAKCIACETDFDPKCSNVYSVNVDEWSALGHHMHQMCGRVEKLIGQNCVLIKWDNGVVCLLPLLFVLHSPRSLYALAHTFAELGGEADDSGRGKKRISSLRREGRE
ncbi:hypothetical protein GPALN_005394 [Globodera pallida]|nr:hypothetical protein GPALN_005394 [Globodera pallida]